MYLKRFASNLSYLLLNSDLTLLSISEITGVSTSTINKILHSQQAPSLKTFEKICRGLSLTPNDFLTSGKIKIPEKYLSKSVTKILVFYESGQNLGFPVCPGCNITLDREYQSYCDRCGCKLNWSNFSNAEIIYKPYKRVELKNKRSPT